MKINYIKTIGFRKFENEFETELYDITSISGGNTKGKTNILYALVWAFLGTNLTGDDKVWLGNKKSDNCCVELKFTDNNDIEHTLVRYKSKYKNQENFILLDDKKIEQDKLQSFYGEKKLFLSILNPNYFLNKKPAEQKELIDKYLPNLDVSVAYNKLDDSEKKYLEGIPRNIKEYIEDLNSDKKMYEDKIKTLRGKIEYASNTSNQTLEAKRTFDKEEELSLARQELSFLNSKYTNIDKDKQQKIVDNLTNNISNTEKEIKDLSIEMSNGKSKYLQIKSTSVSCCPMCNQEIKDQAKITTIENMKMQLEGLFKKKTNLEENLSNLKSRMVVEKCILYASESDSNIERAKRIEEVRIQIQQLEQEQLEIEKHNNMVSITENNINIAKQDILSFKQQIRETEKLIDNLKQTKNIAQKLFINYLEEKMKFATQHLKNVKIKYYTVLKDSGELKEDFIITYNGNELKNLSRSETIATSLELCNMFNKISNINLPLFIDDSESCADYNFTQDYSKDTQLLIARVVKGQELVIQDDTTEEDYLQVA